MIRIKITTMLDKKKKEEKEDDDEASRKNSELSKVPSMTLLLSFVEFC
jgi:hypothetical protein